MREPSDSRPEYSPPSTDRRTLLRTGAGVAALAAAGPLAGCFGAPVGDSSDGDGVAGGDGDAGTTYPVAERADLLPRDLSMVSYTHLDGLLSDPVYSQVIDAYVGAIYGGFGGGPESLEALRATWDRELPMAFDGLHETIGGNLLTPGSLGSVMVAFTDWDRDPVFDAARDYLPGESIERRTHAGSPMLVPTFEEDVPQGFGFALGSLGDGRFAFGTLDPVERVHEVAAGQAEPLAGTLRDGLLAAPDGPMQMAVEPPDVSAFGGNSSDSGGSSDVATASEDVDSIDGSDDAASEDPPATPPPSPTPPAGTPMDDSRLIERLSHAYGGLYADGDRRGFALTLVGADASAARTLSDQADSVLDDWRQGGGGDNPLRPAIEDITVTRDGERVTVRYEAPREDIEDLLAAIESMTGRRTTGTPPATEPEPTGPFHLLSASGDVEDGAIGGVRLVVRPTEDAPPVDMREVFVRFVGPDLPEYDYAFFHPDREVPDVEDFGRYGLEVLGGEAPVLDAPDQAAVLRIDLGEDTPEDGLSPFGNAFQPGTRLTAVVGSQDGASSFPLVIPEALDGDSVSLEPE